MNDHTASTQGLKNVDAGTFQELIQDDPEAEILDVRTYFEYAGGHLPDARLFDLMDPDWPDRINALDREKTYLLYCRSGNRSFQAGMYMQQLGFKHVVNLDRGIISWTGDIATD